MRRWHLTVVLGVLAAVGVMVAFGRRAAEQGGVGLTPAASSPEASPVGPSIAPALPAPVLVLPPDPPEERRHAACDGNLYAEGESMPKCGRG